MASAEPKEPELDSEEEDGDYVPVDDDEDAAEDEAYEKLEGGDDPDDPGVAWAHMVAPGVSSPRAV
jgi:hypothetical protein